MVGRQLSRYRIVEEVGSGGMAVVYRGLDTSLEREVAVKVLHPHLASKEESRKRFSREAKAVARLHHPHILEIYDFSGEEGAESFIVTEFIRGRTLRQFAEETPLEPPEVAAMAVMELADALEHAHAIGVIHRDLKPENVMIRDDGCLKLTDFGIARILDREEKMTMTGALVGSPAHMAPEIIEGEEARPESDIFSLGTILYWLCTRHLPFMAANTTATLKRILDAEYDDPRVHNATISDGLCDIIAKCLAREPSARYSSAALLRDALVSELASVGVDRPGEELATFFADPIGTGTRLKGALRTTLLTQARGHVAAGSTPKAMAALSRVLALDPTCAEALALLDHLKRRKRRNKLLAMGALALAGVGVLGVTGLGVLRLVNEYDERIIQQKLAEQMRQEESARVEAARVLAAQEAAEAELKKQQDEREEKAAEEAARATKEAADAKARAEAERLEREHRVATARGEELERGHARDTRSVPVDPSRWIKVRILPHPYADITVDGKKVASQLPAWQTTLPPGPHVVLLEHPGSAPVSRTVDLKEGQEELEIRERLEPLPVQIKVDCNVPTAAVLVDGQARATAGQSMANPILLPMPKDTSGNLQYRTTIKLTVSAAGYRDWVSAAEPVAAGQVLMPKVELKPQ